MARSILAVVTGIVAIAVLAFSADGIAWLMKVETTSLPFLWISIAYTAMFSGVGGAVTAKIARGSGFRDALILAGIQFAAGVVAVVSLFQPSLLWYYPVNLVLSTGAIIACGHAVSRGA